MREFPKYEDLPVDPTSPPGSSWGVFGAGDEVGTLNFIEPEHVVQAAQLVTRGRIFPLNWKWELPSPPLFGRKPYVHGMMTDDGGGAEDWFDDFYPQSSSQWDALSHMSHPEYGYYNGVPAEETPGFGGDRLGIAAWAERGIAGRFVLLDVAGHREREGRPLDCARSEFVGPDELEAVAAAQGVDLAKDTSMILLLHFGWTRWYEQADQATRLQLSLSDEFDSPGIARSESMAAWLWDRRVAAIVADNPSIEATPYIDGDPEGFLHYRLISLLGMAQGELFDLHELAVYCAAQGRYEGLFTSAPINVAGGVGSTSNALALM